MIFLIVLKAASQRSRCRQSCFLETLLGMKIATFSLCPHMAFPVCAHTSLVSLLSPNSLFLYGHQSDWIKSQPNSLILNLSL